MMVSRLTGLMVLVPIWFLTRLVFRGVPGRIQDMVKNDVERAVKPVKTVVGQGARRVGQQAQEGMQNARRTAQQRLPTQSGARRV